MGHEFRHLVAPLLLLLLLLLPVASSGCTQFKPFPTMKVIDPGPRPEPNGPFERSLRSAEKPCHWFCYRFIYPFLP